MAKVVTSAGLNEFVSTGKHDTIAPDKPVVNKEAPPLDVKQDKPLADVKEIPKEPEDDIYAGEDEPTKAEIAKAQRFDALMRKKHREMKAADAAAKIAREEAAEADRLAESQFNRARLAEQKLSEIEAELKQAKQSTQVKAPEMKEPDESDPQFQDNGQFNWRKFTKAQAEYVATKAVADDRAKQDEIRRATEAQEAQRRAEVHIQRAIEAHPDYQEVLGAADVKTHKALLQYLSASEHIGEVSYYLAKNPEFVATLNKLNPLKAIAEIGKLELTFEKPAKVATPAPEIPKASGAPAPITPLSSSLAVNTNTDPSKMSYKELRAYERSRQRR